MLAGSAKFRLFAPHRFRLRSPYSRRYIRHGLHTLTLSSDADAETFWQAATPLGRWLFAMVTVVLLLSVLAVLLNLNVA
jgi:hypothetical protein